MGITYNILPKFDDKEIKRMLKSGTLEELILLPLSVGEYHSDWKYAQDVCIGLINHDDEKVRANAALGLAYTARTKGKLEKHVVKPALIKLLKDCSEDNKWRVIDAIEDINLFLKWRISI